MIRTRLTDLVGCMVPIQQAPMGTVSSPRLAVAVAEAGGIGSINTLGVSPKPSGSASTRCASRPTACSR